MLFENLFTPHYYTDTWHPLPLGSEQLSEDAYLYPLFVNLKDCKDFCENLNSLHIKSKRCNSCNKYYGILGYEINGKYVCRKHNTPIAVLAENHIISKFIKESDLIPTANDIKCDYVFDMFLLCREDIHMHLTNINDIRDYATLIEALAYQEHFNNTFADNVNRLGLKCENIDSYLDKLYSFVRYKNPALMEVYNGLGGTTRGLCRALSRANFGSYEYDAATYVFVIAALTKEINTTMSLSKSQYDFVLKEITKRHNPFGDELMDCISFNKYPHSLSKFIDRALEDDHVLYYNSEALDYLQVKSILG